MLYYLRGSRDNSQSFGEKKRGVYVTEIVVRVDSVLEDHGNYYMKLYSF